MLWLREVHKALLKHIKTTMANTYDYRGVLVEPKIFTSNPHMDLKKEGYPSITIYNVNFDESISHSDVNSYIIIDNGNGTKTKKFKAPNFLFKFQLDFWTKTRTDMDALLLKWTINNPKFSIIDIEDSTGEYVYPCNFTTRTPVNLDSLSAQEDNIYRTMIPCEILVPIDNSISTQATYKEVEGVTLNKNTE